MAFLLQQIYLTRKKSTLTFTHSTPHTTPTTHAHSPTHTHTYTPLLGVKHSQAQQMLRFECLPCIRNENRIKYKINCCYVLLCGWPPSLPHPFSTSSPLFSSRNLLVSFCGRFDVGAMWTAFCCNPGMVCPLLICKSCDSIRLFLNSICGIGSI